MYNTSRQHKLYICNIFEKILTNDINVTYVKQWLLYCLLKTIIITQIISESY